MACPGLRVAAVGLATLLAAVPARAALSDSEIQTLVEVLLRDKKIIGLSKIPRIVDVFARRLQIHFHRRDDDGGNPCHLPVC